MMNSTRAANESNSILFVKNLPFRVTGAELYQLFGQYGPIRQVRLGVKKQTRGTAFVVFENRNDAQMALESMRGFKVGDRYIAVLYFSPRMQEGDGVNSTDNRLSTAQIPEMLSTNERKAKLKV